MDSPLAPIFVDASKAASDPTLLDLAALEALLRASWRAGQAAWPGVDLAAETYVAHLARRWSALAPRPSLATMPAVDLYLACACAEGLPGAARAFGAAYDRHMRAIAGRLDGAADLREEAIQRARTRLLVAVGERPPKIGEYDGRGSLLAFVRVITLRAGLELLRRRDPLRGAASIDDRGAVELDALALDPELEYLKELYRGAFKEAFAEAIAALEARTRTLLRYQLVDGLSVDELARIYAIHRATAARRLARAREALAMAVHERLRVRLGLDTRELESVMRLVRSRLDLSARRLLATDG